MIQLFLSDDSLLGPDVTFFSYMAVWFADLVLFIYYDLPFCVWLYTTEDIFTPSPQVDFTFCKELAKSLDEVNKLNMNHTAAKAKLDIDELFEAYRLRFPKSNTSELLIWFGVIVVGCITLYFTKD